MVLAREELLPRYDYECEACHLVFEVKQSFSSEPVATCPNCNNGARRVIHAVPIVFKGSGFYVNDYGKGGGATGTGSDAKDSDTKADTKAESKPDSKADSSAPSKSESKKESASKK